MIGGIGDEGSFAGARATVSSQPSFMPASPAKTMATSWADTREPASVSQAHTVGLTQTRPSPHSLYVLYYIYCFLFTNVVKCGEAIGNAMKAKKGDRQEMKGQAMAQVRATISFPPEIYEVLENIAKEKKVSLAWVVREAAEKYIEDKWPLFHSPGKTS